MLFGLRCHFCGTRSKYYRGTSEFQCQSCEAWNFFDKKGEIADTPARVAAAPRSQPSQVKPSRTFAHPGASSKDFRPQDQPQTFCQTCLTNQRIVTESLANYLPDEEHPQYYEYERNLPQYKAGLEERYPQICKKCAPLAQATIAKADRYGLQQNVAKNMRDTNARRGRSNKGQRDDRGKWAMRRGLGVLRMMLYASLLVQAAWHAYSLCMALFNTQDPLSLEAVSLDGDELAFDPTPSDCAKEALYLRFYTSCAKLMSSFISRALVTSSLLIWYNPGLPLWYHHTIRVESVHGQGQYFLMQVILLVTRTVAWINLSNTDVASGLTKSQLLAAHGFMAAFLPLLQKYSERVIRYDAWRIKGKMMRSPDESDVFGRYAGPGKDTSPPQASSIPPTRLFERNYKPFPIENLAPRVTRSTANHPPPSPPDSQSVSDEEMEDQMEWQPTVKPQMPGAPNTATYQPRNTSSTNSYSFGMSQPATKGWSPMRDELFGTRSEHCALEQRRKEEFEQARAREQDEQHRSPFRGSLPMDPMQRRLRSSQARVGKREVPITQRDDFYSQMSKSFGGERFAGKIGNIDRRTETTGKKGGAGLGGMSLNDEDNDDDDDDDDDFSPVKRGDAAARSGMQFREGQWRLEDKTEATGLEDLFGGRSFRINDEPTVVAQGGRGGAGDAVLTGPVWPVGKVVLFAIPALVAAVGWNVGPVRRAVCLWLVERLEGMGY